MYLLRSLGEPFVMLYISSVCIKFSVEVLLSFLKLKFLYTIKVVNVVRKVLIICNLHST